MICAACGKTKESLKLCAACKEVRYCGKTCQKNHLKDHRNECMRKELDMKAQQVVTSKLESLGISNPADLDNPNSDLWKPPSRPECPICMLTLPLGADGLMYKVCCGKLVCGGCDLKNDEIIDENRAADRVSVPLKYSCAFCREPAPSGREDALEQVKKRMGMHDPEAFMCMSQRYSKGEGVSKDARKAFDYILRAAELGSVNAYHWLAVEYRTGLFVDADEEKQKGFLQLGAMGGDETARNHLGVLELENGHEDIAVRHWRIAASAGLEASVFNIKQMYRRDLVSKEEFAETLRAYQTARDDLKSVERDRFFAVKAEKYK